MSILAPRTKPFEVLQLSRKNMTILLQVLNARDAGVGEQTLLHAAKVLQTLMQRNVAVSLQK
jgi:hypothetical protein